MTRAHLLKWHYRIGIISAVLVLLMAITGILINHTTRLGLGNNYVQTKWILDWYNIAPKSEVVTYRYKNNYITQIDSRIFLNTKTQAGKELPHTPSKLKGIVESNRLIAIATNREIFLLTRKGQLVERIVNQSKHWKDLTNIGVGRIEATERIWIKTRSGYFYANAELSQWKHVDNISAYQISWARRDQLPTAATTNILQLYRGKGLSMERVLLDVHTGRFLGSWGIYVMDGAAIMFILLALTGITIWIKRRKKLTQQTKVS